MHIYFLFVVIHKEFAANPQKDAGSLFVLHEHM